MSISNNLPSRLGRRAGFTILELIVALAVFLVSVTIVGSYIFSGMNQNRFALEQTDAIEHAKRGIDSMIKEVREAGNGQNGDFPIIEALDQSFTFYSDVDSDEATEKIRYYLSGTNLVKGVIEPTATVPPTYPPENESTTTISQYVRNGSDPIFYYYNGDYPADTANNPLTVPPDLNQVKLVRMFLSINIDPTKAPSDFYLEVFAQLRNLKDNL